MTQPPLPGDPPPPRRRRRAEPPPLPAKPAERSGPAARARREQIVRAPLASLLKDVRMVNLLEKLGCIYLGDVLKADPADLAGRGLGKNGLTELARLVQRLPIPLPGPWLEAT